MEEAANNGTDDALVVRNEKVPIRALRGRSRRHISALINPVKIIPTDQALDRYWPGLAQLCGIEGQFIGSLERDTDPFVKILNVWEEKDPENSTIDKLLGFLEQIDRYDVIQDLEEEIKEDIRIFQANPTKPRLPNLAADKDIITRDDVTRLANGEGPQMYDAFVLFVDSDIDFATELIDTMEKQYGMKFCVKERDLVGGGLEFDVMTRLITERCSRLIVVLSPAFFDSQSNNFFVKYAQSVGIENNTQRKVIPCVCKPCPILPSYLTGYSCLWYRHNQFWSYWDRLRDSIISPDREILSRSHSENTQTVRKKQNNNNLQPIIHREPSVLKPVNHIRFNSMVNLNTVETERILTDNTLSASTSANSLGYSSDSKKGKKLGLNNGLKQIKNFFSKNNKRKMCSTPQ